jgi:hypothetical protein
MLIDNQPYSRHGSQLMLMPGNTKGGKYHCTIDLLFDWFGLVCFVNKNKNCQLSYSWFQTSQTGGQRYNYTSAFSITCSCWTIQISRQYWKPILLTDEIGRFPVKLTLKNVKFYTYQKSIYCMTMISCYLLSSCPRNQGK